MSDPTHRHIIIPGATYVPARYAQMRCDGPGAGGPFACKLPPARAPRIIVPSRLWTMPGHRPLRMWTTLHYCERHKEPSHAPKLEDFLTDKCKAEFERSAKRARPAEFLCDFEAAFIEWILVTTPEYRRWLERLEVKAQVLQ